ncbi:putative endo-1,3(4)-beta-glucanase [Helianthus anomalus]
MPSSYPGRHMPLPRLEPSTSEKRWVSVANWATPVGCEPDLSYGENPNLQLVDWTLPALEREGVGEEWKGFVYALQGVYDKDVYLTLICFLIAHRDMMFQGCVRKRRIQIL